MSIKLNSLEYLGSVNLARLFGDPAAIAAQGSNAAYHVNRAWFEPLLPAGSPPMVTIVPSPDGIEEEMKAYGGSGVIDFDVKGAPVGGAWYVIAIEESDFGPSASIYIPEGADPEAVSAVRSAWESAQ